MTLVFIFLSMVTVALGYTCNEMGYQCPYGMRHKGSVYCNPPCNEMQCCEEKCSKSSYFGSTAGNMCSAYNKIVSDTAYCSSIQCSGDDSDTCCEETCASYSQNCPIGYSRREDKYLCASSPCLQKECCVLNIARHNIQAISTATIRSVEVKDIFSGDYSGKQSISPRPVAVSSASFSLPFTVVGPLNTLTIHNQPVGQMQIQRGSTTIVTLNDLPDDTFALYDENNQYYNLRDIGNETIDAKLVCKEESWVVNIRQEVDQEAPKRCMLNVVRPLPCWIRRISVRIWDRVYYFPVLGWSRSCCGKDTGRFGWYSNATGCYQGNGPFLSEAQCTSTCEPFERPDDPCVFGNLTLAHGASTNCTGGTTCTCNDGALDCNNCRYRREIHDLHQNSPDDELRLVRALQWVSAGCDGACNGWLVNILQDHSAYGGHAHGNSKFFPWHRWYLKELEIKLQLYHPCVTIPWWDWTLDQLESSGNFGWVKADSPFTVWGDLNSNSNADMGEFTASDWTIPASYGQLARSSSLASISSMATTATIANYLARATYGAPDNFKAFEGPHGTPHVMIGGQMGNMRSPSDPLFWIHHAGVDKLWYDWQDLHAPGTNYDANPAAQLSPQWPGVTTNDVFDSRGSLGVCYDGVFGVPPAAGRRLTASRRRLPTAIEYGLIAAVTSPILTTVEMSTLRQLEQEVTAIQHAMTFSSQATGQDGNTCGKSSENCTWSLENCIGPECCMDSFAEGMNMDLEFFRRNQCVDHSFKDKLVNDATFKNLVDTARAIRPDVCASIQCTAHSTCREGRCICDVGYKLENRHCVPQYGSQECPAGCNAWYDGCNTCTCDGPGQLGACTKRFCDVYEEAKCVDEVCPVGCETWYDGCNTCTCAGTGQLGACTKRFCIQKGDAYCSKFKQTPPTNVKDTLPPVITVQRRDVELTDTIQKEMKPNLFFSQPKNETLNIIVEHDEAVVFNPRVMGLNQPESGKGYLSLDVLDLSKMKNMSIDRVVFDGVEKTFSNQAIAFEDRIVSDNDMNDLVLSMDSGKEIRVGGNAIVSRMPSEPITLQTKSAGRRLSSPRSVLFQRVLVPIEIDFSRFVFCTAKIYVTIGHISFDFTITRTGKQCCAVQTGSGGWRYSGGICTNSSSSGPFGSLSTCENLCVPDQCPLPGPRGVVKAHNSKFFSCRCNDGHWDEPAGCKHRKEVADLTADERTQLIDAMHWVKEGCQPDGCGSFQTVHPPSGGTLDWELMEFFTDHVRYGTDAHGQWKFFPWHRKYLKDYESKLQLYDPCVTIPWWDWTQDVDNTDGNFHKNWITAAGTDWGAISNDDSIVGSGTSDGMKVGRFRCNEGVDAGHNDTAVVGNDWSSGSSTLGNCLWRNSATGFISSLPDDAMIADYMSRTDYDGWDSLMDFESSPHGTPHVMVGGTGSVRGQMGNGRSPFDPIFFIHHAGVDKLWWDWQNADPAHFNDLGGAGRAAQQLSTQWPATTAGDVLDSEGDLKVCYSEPRPTFTWVELPSIKSLAESLVLSAAGRGGRRLATKRRLPHITTWVTSFAELDIPTNANEEDIRDTVIGEQAGCYNPIPYDVIKQTVSDGGSLAGKSLTWDDRCLDNWYVMMNQDPQHAADAATVKDWQEVMRNMTMTQKEAVVASGNCKMDNCTQDALKQQYMENHQCPQ